MSLELPQARRPRVVVSVPFTAEAFEAVALSAEALGQKVSVFIRNSALRRAGREWEFPEISVSINATWWLSLLHKAGWTPERKSEV